MWDGAWMAGLSKIAAAVGEPARLAALDSYAVLDTLPEQDFDDIAHLAARLCAAPVALISFVASDRQWFKARVGFEPDQTDLDSSVCRFVLVEPDLLVIPDLQADPRTCRNPLVTGAPHIRFYAGAPLRTPAGDVLGSLCVIDTAPRPQGLTAFQAEDLRRLARQVMDQLELRHLVRQRDGALLASQTAKEALASSEAHWRGLFENLREGLVLGRPVRDERGRIVDWRYEDVNAAWSDLVGLDVSSVVGRTVREVLPSVEQDWIDLAQVVDTDEVITFTRRVGQLDRWYEGRASAVGPELFSILFLEVTERVRAAKVLTDSTARKLALAKLGDHLRAARSANAMSFVAASILARTLGATRAGYCAVDARNEVIDVPPDWCAPGVGSVEGRHSFRAYGSYIEDLKAGRTVIVSDTMSDPRTAERAEALDSIAVRALVNSPVLEGGVLASISFVHFDAPREITSEEQAFIRAVADRTEVGIARVKAEERQALVNGEISHRLKNVLAMVQAVAVQTLKGRAEPEAVASFTLRLAAIAKAQDALLRAEWAEADLQALVREVVDLAGVEGRVDCTGPSVQVGQRAALSTTLLLHELTTNAVKYGALSTPEGRVSVSWELAGEGADRELVLEWCERGGPPAAEPTRKGFGSRLLKLGLVGTGGSALAFARDGFSASFRAPLRQVAEA